VTLSQFDSLFYQQLAFWSGDEDAGVNTEVKPVELAMSQYIGGRLMAKTAFNQVPEGCLLFRAQFVVKV